MKIVTFNIRLDCGMDGDNNFSLRRDFILRKLRREDPDIVCFQEVLPHVAAWLKKSLPEYDIVGCPRGALLDDEQACVAYRRNRFNLLRMEAFWLSPTSDVPGSRYEVQSPCPRICTEIILQDLSQGTAFRLLNTHLDHEGQPARILAVEQILEKLRTEIFFPGIPVLLTGDMNAEPDSEEMNLVTRSSGLQNLTEGVGATFHGFGKAEPAAIDYIFATREFTCTRLEKWTDREGPLYLSDHYPVCAQLSLQQETPPLPCGNT
ncbi:MAG: endonuclease/exonuclease/phosphatase family protein [Faecousia sp.]